MITSDSIIYTFITCFKYMKSFLISKGNMFAVLETSEPFHFAIKYM